MITTSEARAYKKHARLFFVGSVRLFDSCWRELGDFCVRDTDDIDRLLDELAAEKVNNPRSSFYIYGR